MPCPAGGLPRIRAFLHQPSRRRVPHLPIARLVDALEAFGADGSSHFDDVHPFAGVTAVTP